MAERLRNLRRTPGMILDLDDTLCLERDYVRSGFRAVGRFLHKTVGVTSGGDELWADFEAGIRGNTFNRLLDRHGLEERIEISALVEVYRTHKPEIQLIADASDAIDRWSDGFLGVITDGPASSQRAKAEALGLPDLVDHIVFTGEYGPGFSKPHERAFAEMEKVSGLSGAELTYVGDNPHKDFIAPLARSWHAVRIIRAGALHENEPNAQDVAVVADLSFA